MKVYDLRILVIGLFACIYTTNIVAQQSSSTDSLMQALETAEEDTHKVHLLNDLSRAFREQNLDKAKAYARQARELGERLSHERGLLDGIKNDASVLLLEGKYEETITLAEEGRRMAAQWERKRELAYILELICTTYGMQGYYEKGIPYCEAALKESQEARVDELSAHIMQNIGTMYGHQGAQDKSIAWYMDALELYENLGDKRGTSDILFNMGAIYSGQGNTEKGLKYYQRALEEGKSVMGKLRLARLYLNIGFIYSKSDPEKALQYYSQSLKLDEEVGHTSGTAMVLNSMGLLYEAQKKEGKALEHFRRAMDIYEAIGNESGLMNTLSNIANVYKHQGHYKKALQYGEKSLAIAKETGRKPAEVRICLNLSWICMKMNNAPEALVYFENYLDVKDSLYDAESNQRIAEMQVRYETAEKEKQIALLEKDKVIQEAALSKSTLQRNALSVGLLLVAFLAAIWIRSYRYRLRTQKKLAEQADETNRQKTLKLIKEEQLRSVKAYIEGQENERMRIASELHDGIVGSLAAVKLHLSSEAPEKGTTQAEAIEDLRKIGEETRSLSHRLSPLPVFGGTFTSVLQHFIRNLEKAGSLKIHLDAFPATELNQLDEFIQSNIYRIIQELLNNVVKHAQASEATVQLIHHEENINLVVTDDGLGFDMEKSQTGIGMGTIRSRLDLIEGEMAIDSYPKKGSSISIQIPVIREKATIPA